MAAQRRYPGFAAGDGYAGRGRGEHRIEAGRGCCTSTLALPHVK
jgi:hypothetical protein